MPLIFPYVDLDCCPTIRTSGAQRSELNQLYAKTKRIVNGRPSYIDHSNKYGVWWTHIDWMIGSYSNIDNNKITHGYIQNNQDTSCPSQSDHWQEYFNSKWADNANAQIYCSGK